MADLIKRDEVLSIINDAIRSQDHSLSRLKERITALPTIEAEPKDCKKCKSHMAFLMAKMAYDDRRAEPKHGRWIIESDEAVMHCNSCGWLVEYYTGLEEEWNFCPRCGAKMDEVEE